MLSHSLFFVFLRCAALCATNQPTNQTKILSTNKNACSIFALVFDSRVFILICSVDPRARGGGGVWLDGDRVLTRFGVQMMHSFFLAACGLFVCFYFWYDEILATRQRNVKEAMRYY
jgi:hypothetical protein